jgi:hypothetical protein
MADETLTVRIGEVEHEPVPGQPFTFGRAASCTVCLDPDDVSISRLAGSIDWESGAWWLSNASNTRQLDLVDEVGFRSVLTPGRRAAVEGRLRVIVQGASGSHELILLGPGPKITCVGGQATGLPTEIGADVSINDADRAALVALFAGYLEEGPRYDPYPKSYAAAAARLGWPRTTLVRRIEYLRKRLSKAGVPNMDGWNALSNLAEYVLAAKIITRDDLR